MKILMTVMMTMAMATSVYAVDCKEGDQCTAEQCTAAKLGRSAEGKCVKVAASEATSTDCDKIVSGTGAKPAEGAGGAAGATPTKVKDQ